MPNISYLVYQKCCACKERLDKKNRNRNIRQITQNTIEKTKAFFLNDSISLKDYICSRCRTQVGKNKKPLIKSNILINNSTSTIDKVVSTTTTTTTESNENIVQDTDSNVLCEYKNQTNEKILSKVKTITLPTAYATHKHCLLCENTKGLRTVKPESIVFAYLNHGIMIKHHARCCDRHLDVKGDIVASEYSNMQTRLVAHNADEMIRFDLCVRSQQKLQYELQNSSGIFDKFKNMAALDEELCKKVTGWTKLEFVRFSKYITCIRDTCGRTKEQLIAIYRFWLSKGMDQCSLAMLKSNTNQQQISHYLAQIRSVINKEFVPLFLGANKGKQFFLEHNTESVRVLHELDDDVLTIIADGTYTRLEKSSDNSFQYATFSMQKLQNLIKPFIICCADGYFIDCYGPFAANLNDAKIFRYILARDKDFQNLITPHDKTIMFLDRGKCFYLML